MDQFEIIKSKRKTVSIEISVDGKITVRAPLYMNDTQIRAIIDEKSDWINNKLDIISTKQAQRNNFEYIFDATYIKTLSEKAREYIVPKVAYWASVMGVSYNKIFIKHQKTRWGSCSGKKNLNFNCLLYLLGEDIADYIVIHELSHLRYMNHSKSFWSTVATFCPDYKTIQTLLKERGNLKIKYISSCKYENVIDYPLDSVTEANLKTADWSTRDVMVGSVRNDSQLAACLEGNFYYAPVSSFECESVSPLQVAIFESVYKNNPGIRYVGNIVDTMVVKRREIPVQYNKSKENTDYYMFRVDGWRTLQNAIDVRTDSVQNPRFSNKFLLENCKNAYELFCIDNENQYRLVNLIRSLIKGFDGKTKICVSVNGWLKVFSIEGRLLFTNENNKILCDIPMIEYRKNPKETFVLIKSTVKI